MLYFIKRYWESGYAADGLWFDWENEDYTGYERNKGSRWYNHYDEYGEQNYKCG